MKFTFIDKENLCIYDGGKTAIFSSSHIARYRETATRDQKSKAWKQNSDAMLYDDFFNRNERVEVNINALSPTLEENKLVYSFTVNESSGIYYKYTDDEKKTEAHVISSNDEVFSGVVVSKNGEMGGVVQSNALNSNVAVFSKDGGDYKCLTGGDSKDENPFFGKNGDIYFNSYGVGRDLSNEFVKYMPSEILKLNVYSMQIETLVADGRNSYIKPVLDSEDTLYCIRKPGEEREKSNPIISILLMPVRIIEAMIGFVSMFVHIFAGKPLVDGKGKTNSGGGAAKNADTKKIFVHNHLLNVEKELKRNQKEQDGGFIPRSWKLVKISKNQDDFSAQYDHGMAQELASGVVDFCLLEENGEKILVYTNGKRIFALRENGKKEKLAHTDFCVSLGAVQSYSSDGDDLFGKI